MDSSKPGQEGGGLTRRSVLQRGVYGGIALSGAGTLLAACGGGSPNTATTTSPAAGAIKAGGTLRVGLSGGSSADTLDPHNPLTDPDIARVFQLYDTLAVNNPDANVEMGLAESIEASGSASVWVVKLKPELTFHNGAPVNADAVIASIRRILDPKSPGRGATALANVGKKGMTKVDDLTVRFKLSEPNSEFPRVLAEYYNGIVPTDFNVSRPIGTGPFKYKSFSAGEQSEFVAFPNYYRGRPKLDAVVIIDLAEDTARVNALLGGQVDAINNLPFSQIAAIQGGAAEVLQAETGNWVPFTMRCDVAPFNDPDVRMAMRLIIDRNQVVGQAFGGQAQVANDLFARYDPGYNHDLPQRVQEVDRAQSLLAKKGMSDLSVQLVTSDVTVGAVESAQVLAQQAEAAGVNVKLRQVTPDVFYGSSYLKWPFAQNYWFTRYYLGQVAESTLPNSGNNETHFNDSRYVSLYKQALAELDEGRRNDLTHEMQKIEWETGGYIIPSFNNQTDAYSKKVTGFTPAKTGVPLGNYGFHAVGFVA